jgi:hypothetical protein
MSGYLKHLVCSLMALSLSCCEPGEHPCGQVPNAYDALLSCYVYDSVTNETIIRKFGSLYSSLGSKLLDENGNDVLTEEPINSTGKMEIQIAIKAIDTIGVVVTKIYYLHLVDHLNVEKDIDTILVTYKLINANNCHRIDFDDFKCFYNNRLYATEFPWDVYPGLIFYK